MNKMIKYAGHLLPGALEIVKEAVSLVQTISRLELEKKQMERQFQLSMHEINKRAELFIARIEQDVKVFFEKAQIVKERIESENFLISQAIDLTRLCMKDCSSDENRLQLMETMCRLITVNSLSSNQLVGKLCVASCNDQTGFSGDHSNE